MSERLGLIFPRFRYPSGDFPLGVATLASFVREQLGIEVVICDTTFDPRLEKIAEFLDREQPTMVGVGMSTLMLGEGLVACRMARERGLPVFVGGPHPTTYPDELIADPNVDAVVIGEGEYATIDLVRMFMSGRRHEVTGALVKDLDGTIWASRTRRPVEDLDSLPWPAWDLIDMEAYIAAWGQLDSYRPGLRGVNLVASRGCPFECSFCQPVLDAMFGKRLRQRSPESVVAELAELKRRFDIEGAWFTDDTFTTNRKWVLRFCESLRESGLDLAWGCTTRANLIEPDLMRTMHHYGLRKIGIGMESATEHVREGIYKKGVSEEAIRHTVHTAHEVGVQTLLFLMLGAPGESRGEMLRTIHMATELPASEASFSLFVPIPGTDLHERMLGEGYEMSDDYTDYDYYARQPFDHELSRRQLRMIQRYAYLRFYTHPYRWRSMARTAASLKGLRSMGRKLKRIVPHEAAPRQDGARVRSGGAASAVRARG
ncbi:MAG: B12-binding domain-containing radical SAM protein [Alphaproteobacteria bacterium]|nr:B12-binding domain-containing radical SAM protein [Alphaproteobacteria bacterium]MCB9792313.1 B12-binding domain-containing radical SAM protein [Alphaproteobacteria bacterium]